MQDVSWDRTLGARRTLAEESGRLRYERTLLLQQVLAVHSGLEDGTATAAWRTLLRTARWLEADDAVRALEER